MRILITGATGFIGSHLSRRLASKHRVFALARTLPTKEHSPGIKWIECDLAGSLDEAKLPSQMDAIIHLAQSKSYKEFPEQARDIFEVNTHSTFQLLEYGRRIGINQFIYASSGGIYGFREEGFVETDPVNPLNFYLSSKYCAELLIANYHQLFSTIVLRLFFVYGEGQSQAMFIPRLVHSVRQGQPISLQGADGLRSNPAYVGDVVAAIENAIALEGNHLINVGGPQVLSLREMGNVIGATLGCKPVFDIYSDQEPTHLVGDLRKMKKLLGEPKIRFTDGVARICKEAVEEAKLKREY